MLREIWRDVKGYGGLYQVSNLGKIYSNNSNNLMKPYPNNKGYLKIDLYKNGKRKKFLVHRIVAEAFIANPNNYPEINHKDENKTNNNVSNLEFCDHKYNIGYGTGHERTTEKVKKAVFCVELNTRFKSITEASLITGICLQSISMCCLGKYKTAGQMHWIRGE